ncbi:hypothetical protein P7C70_g9615, partial [Phenoliferia sp. Uapishka_3]
GGKEKEKAKRRPVASRIEAMMSAAATEEDALGLASASGSGKKTSGAGGKKGVGGKDESNDENTAPAAKGATSVGTPVQKNVAKARLGSVSASGRSGSVGPTSSTKKGLAGVMEKTGVYGYRPPGMSNKMKIPRLHANLKPPPPPKPPVPKEKLRKKKGQEDYSDEDKPWYETKHPEEWDSDDREKFAKVQKRREKGWDSP